MSELSVGTYNASTVPRILHTKCVSGQGCAAHFGALCRGAPLELVSRTEVVQIQIPLLPFSSGLNAALNAFARPAKVGDEWALGVASRYSPPRCVVILQRS